MGYRHLEVSIIRPAGIDIARALSVPRSALRTCHAFAGRQRIAWRHRALIDIAIMFTS